MSDLKDDTGKLMWSALPWDQLAELAKVCMYGDSKYLKDNWRAGSTPERYWDAALRHMVAWRTERNDPESGLHHLAHAAVSLLYGMFLDKLKFNVKPECGAVLSSGDNVVVCNLTEGHPGRCEVWE